MAGAHRYRGRSEIAVSAWLSAGATAVGIGAALVGAAATAQAQPGDSTQHSSPDRASHRTPGNSTGKHHAESVAASTHKHSAAAHSAADTPTSTTNTGSTRPTSHAKAAAESAPPATEAQALAAAPSAPDSDAGSASAPSATVVLEKVGRHSTDRRALASAATAEISKAAPAGSSSGSGALDALAAVSQLASAPVESTIRPAAVTTAANWLGNNIATPGSSVTTALQEISQAQKAVGNNFLPQAFLAVAKWALDTWQDTNAAAIAFVGRYSTGPLSFVANAMLNFNESLPGLAQNALHTAQFLTLTNATVHSLIGQAAQDGRVYASVKLTMYNTSEPIVEISVNGGPMVKVLVDTGSSGLVINAASVGTAAGLGLPIATGTSGYSGGLTYAFNVYNTTVSFGSGITTAPTAVDVVTTASQAAYEKYLAVDGVVGVLGIGANALGPGPSLVTSALPGELKDGIYIDEAAGTLQFGPNPRPVRVALSGSPYVAGVVNVLGKSYPINLMIDSGGVYGTIPSTVWTAVGETQVPGGIPIEIYSADGTTLLYSYTTTNTNTPIITTDAAESQQMNTGYTPFALNSIYIAYSTAGGETDFDS